MADYTDNALLASIKALNEVVVPAVDPADPLAREQLRLVTGFLEFLRVRVAHLHERRRFELEHQLALGRRLMPDAAASAEVAARLSAAIVQAEAVGADPEASVDALRGATAVLAAATSGLARAVACADPTTRQRVEQTILAHSARWVDMQRAWFLPQGFELHAGELPPLEQALKAVG
jgi:hypothetical protein